jgi:probable phosphoglycerate mutase
MKIIFVRHGHPDYEKDCLTELGHLHGEAVAERLKDEPISRIYSSSNGRAYETALHICEKKGIPLTKQLDFMREMNWEPLDGTPDWQIYSPWKLADEMVENNEPLLCNWTEREGFAQSNSVKEVEKISKGIDGFLEAFGYAREGNYYRIKKATDETVILVSHGGSSSAAISHLFNLSLPFVCSVFRWDFTAICEVDFHGTDGELISPRFGLTNDAQHIQNIK